MDTTLQVVVVFAAVWAVVFLGGLAWGPVEAWWRHRRTVVAARAARAAVRPLPYVPSQKSGGDR